MDGKQGSHKRARPKRSRHLSEHKKRERSESMQDEICPVMPARIQAIEVAVCHVGDHGQRMPVTGHLVGQGPPQPGKGESLGYLAVLEDILWIIVVDELVLERLTKRHPDDSHQKNANNPDEAEAPDGHIHPLSESLW